MSDKPRNRIGLLAALIGASLPPPEPSRPAFDVNIFPPHRPAEPERESSWDRNKRRARDDERKKKKAVRKQRKKTRGY